MKRRVSKKGAQQEQVDDGAGEEQAQQDGRRTPEPQETVRVASAGCDFDWCQGHVGLIRGLAGHDKHVFCCTGSFLTAPQALYCMSPGDMVPLGCRSLLWCWSGTT